MKSIGIIVSIILLITGTSCEKEVNTKSYSFINVKFTDQEEYIFIETIEANWNINTGTAQLNARGYNLEAFKLYLPLLQSIGFYPNPSISNIYFSNGLDFDPFKVTGGFINITYIDSMTLRGEFKVLMEDTFNGPENKTVIGNFGINVY